MIETSPPARDREAAVDVLAMVANDPGLIGRDEELSRLRDLVAPPYTESRVLLVLGDPGVGKTALLTEAVREARSAGMRVLTVAGRESEQDFPFAGLHQLLRPALDRLDGLPARQADALRGAFAISEDPVPPDPLLTGIGLLTLISGLSDEEPLLVSVDDIQWLDRASLGALAFAARRLESERLVLLAGVRGVVPPDGFERDFRQWLLTPLSLPDAGRLLDAQPVPPRGRSREQVLEQAGGNPLALIELSKMIAADPGAGRHRGPEMPVATGQLTAILAARCAALPSAARAAMLIAAAADSPDLTAAILPELSAAALAPAEAAGLIWLDSPGLRFTHPLVRSAVYHGAPFAERAAAHLTVAESLRGQADRYAWHLAAAALEPDERVASLLEASATQAQRRGGTAAAARAMERAAELSISEADKARRLLAAADLAVTAGQADWVHDLASKVLSLTSNPRLRMAARLKIGWSLIWSNRQADALDVLISVASEACSGLPAIGWDAASLAATIAHQTGLPEARARPRAVLDALDASCPMPPSIADRPRGSYDEARIWLRVCADPFDRRAETVRYLHQIIDAGPAHLIRVGGAAWGLDETELAVRLLREALSRLRAPGVRGASGAALSCLQWACVDSGRWDEALSCAREASDVAAAYKMETVGATADLVTATVLAVRGDHDEVAPLLARVRTAVDEDIYRGFAARIRHAAGLAALASGSYLPAYAQLSQLFAADGTPLHYHFSYYAIADLAAAAARSDRRLEARTRLERALVGLGPEPGPRLEQLTARARGLLASPADAGTLFAAALAGPEGSTWPFERAQLQLDYGEWLRRQRRINDAKPVLGSALDTFRRLGSVPWARRAETELRACGVTARAGKTDRGGLDRLTSQQREIVILARQGLTNSEIADRLFLSPRTVASHLYRSYPKLGIAFRYQLRDIIDDLAAGHR